jgi:ssDNA-binding Zn-finger/Zn-ribbon topoisomerase 1
MTNQTNYYIFGNKGTVWSNKAHAAKTGEATTVCGTPMLSSNWARMEGVTEVGCPECLRRLEEEKIMEDSTLEEIIIKG